jgi:hypothetical protein
VPTCECKAIIATLVPPAMSVINFLLYSRFYETNKGVGRVALGVTPQRSGKEVTLPPPHDVVVVPPVTVVIFWWQTGQSRLAPSSRLAERASPAHGFRSMDLTLIAERRNFGDSGL